MTRHALLLALLPLALPAAPWAETITRAWSADDGTPHVRAYEGEGFALRSAAPVTHHVGAAAEPRSGVETLTFRPSCGVTSTLLGEGRWAQDGRGLDAIFPGPVLIAFPDLRPPGLERLCRAR